MMSEYRNPSSEKTSRVTLGDVIKEVLKDHAREKFPGNAKKQIDYILDRIRRAQSDNAQPVTEEHARAAREILEENFGLEEVKKLLQKEGIELDY